MTVAGWTIPAELHRLIAAGRWPRDADEERRQNGRPLVEPSRVAAFAPEESGVYLLEPGHFATVAQLTGEPLWRTHGAPDEISFEHTVVIADFGPGSDAPIVLDYRLHPNEPAVLRLRWEQGCAGNHWVGVAQSFRRFAQLLGLP